MTNLLAYDTEAEAIEKVANDNDITVAEVIEMLVDYLDEAKIYNGLN